MLCIIKRLPIEFLLAVSIPFIDVRFISFALSVRHRLILDGLEIESLVKHMILLNSGMQDSLLLF